MSGHPSDSSEWARKPAGGSRWIVCAAAAIIFLGLAGEVWAWGPGTHVKLAAEVISNLWLLPAAIAAIIARNRRYFVFGNVATDTVFAKKMSKVKQVCHQWSTGFSLLESAKTDRGRAFAYGYLAHLAADTVAHNKFLPRQMAVSRSTVSFGHLYWEIRADALIDRTYWTQLHHRLEGRYEEPMRLLENHLRQTVLSFRANLAISRRMHLLACLRGWRRSVLLWSRVSRHPLDGELVAEYHREAFERIMDVLARGRASPVLQYDPNGNAALAYARAQRKQLRQMKRAHMPFEQAIEEAAAGHAPGGRSRPTSGRRAAPSASSPDRTA